jgi:hypothetical protein
MRGVLDLLKARTRNLARARLLASQLLRLSDSNHRLCKKFKRDAMTR